MKVAVIGAGWAGCAAAVEATRLGHQVTIFEASRMPGGRARRVDVPFESENLALDNGQHILIGAYTETLKLMTDVGLDSGAALLRMPLTLEFPDGSGLRFASLPAPLDALYGILTARGWGWADKLSLLRASAAWQISRFSCPPDQSVASLCRSVSPRVMATLIEPLCVSALNTPPEYSSGQVFLRVMRDALFAGSGASNLLLPQCDLSALLPDAALGWLRARGGTVCMGQRIQSIGPADNGRWALSITASSLAGSDVAGIYHRVILASPPQEASRLVQGSGVSAKTWLAHAHGLQFEAITTVYAMAPGCVLRQPMLALAAEPDQPAQFVFDRGQLGGPAGLLAFVISASKGDGADLTRQALAQGKKQLGLTNLRPVKTIVDKRATIACLPGLKRPGAAIASGLVACGDYVEGPYPATLEGAVRSGLAAAQHWPRA